MCEARCPCIPPPAMVESCGCCLLGPCPSREHGRVCQEPQESCPRPGMLVGRVNTRSPAQQHQDIHGRCHQGWKRSQRWCPRKSWTSPALQKYQPQQWGCMPRLEERNCCKDGSFQGKLCNLRDADLSNIKDQLFLKNKALKKALTLPKSLCLSEWETHRLGYPTKTHY